MRITEKPSSSYSGAMTPASIERKVERVALTKAATDSGAAFVLALLAGAFVALGATFMLVVKADGTLSFAAVQLLGGFAFTLGLFLVLAAGAELFTGNCLMACAALSGKLEWGRLLRSWGLVYLGNLVGSVAMAAIVVGAGFAGSNGGALGEAAISVATAKTGLAPTAIFFRGVVCNILVCLAVWIGNSADSVSDKFFAALLPVMAFMGVGGEHCVANMFFLPLALMLQGAGVAGSVTLAGCVANIVLATLGNIVGGSIVIAFSYWFVYGRAHKEGE